MLGHTISHYRVLSKLGEGGMGTVYHAEDTRLQRPVALKFLSAQFAAEDELRKRFEREAKAAASLDHPNICTVFDIGESEGRPFIAMAFVDGLSVRDKIGLRPMEVREALDVAVQVARGLQAAHAKGIVHRDIKPANVMLTSQGQARITDFGLALLAEQTRLTGEARAMGSPAYMSPEQTRGRAVDRRTDLWSLGAMLYEMVTGRTPFPGDRADVVFHRIANEEPEPLTALRSGVPLELERIVSKCLAKDPSRRYQHADDLIADLESLQVQLRSGQTRTFTERRPADSTRAVPAPRSRLIAYAGAGLLVLAVAAFAWMRLSNAVDPDVHPRTVKFAFAPAGLVRGGDGNIDAEVSISPNGKHISYVEQNNRQLWIRDIDQEQARPVPGAVNVYQVFWSPDDRHIGYATGPGFTEVMRIPVEGGSPQPVVKTKGLFRRGSWSSDGKTIVYGDDLGLHTVPASGGASTLVIPHGHIEHPSFIDLPGGRRAVMYQTLEKGPYHEVFLQVLGEKQRHFVAASTSTNPYPTFSPTGHVVYVDGSGETLAIWALPYSLQALKPAGKPFPIAQRASSPQVSRTGSLVYSDAPTDLMELTWCDRTGKTISMVGAREYYDAPAVSPDGKRIAVAIRGKGMDVWVMPADRPGKTRITFDGLRPTALSWSPTGDEILYALRGGESLDIFSKSATGDGDASKLVGTPSAETSPELSRDRSFLVYAASSPQSKYDILYRERRPGGALGEAVPIVASPFNETNPRLSPDSRWLAYVSDESGQPEVYVRAFPGGKEKHVVSVNGGRAPRWRKDGREMFYVEDNRRLMAVNLAGGPQWTAGTPHVLFERRWTGGTVASQYDVSPDGRRFLVRERAPEERQLAVHVAHNWFEEFREKRK